MLPDVRQSQGGTGRKEHDGGSGIFGDGIWSFTKHTEKLTFLFLGVATEFFDAAGGVGFRT